MLEAIVNFLNLKLELLNYFEKRHCLSVLVKNDDGLIYPAEYISEGNYDAVDFDAFDGVSYLRLSGEINVDRIDQKYTPKPRVNVTFPLRLVYAVRKDKLTADDAYSFDRVRASIAKQLETDAQDLVAQLDADKIQISTSGYISDAKEIWDDETAETGQFQPKFEVVFGAMEVSITVTTRVECIAAECDDFESDILRTFDFCSTSIQQRLTDAQVTCLSDWLCGTPDPVTIQLNGVTYTTAASGTTFNQQVQNSAGTSIGTAANPSVVADARIGANGNFLAQVPATVDSTIDVHDTVGSDVGSQNGAAWEIGDTTIRNQANDWSDTELAEGTYTLGLQRVVDSDGSNVDTVDYKPIADGAVFTCTPADYGTRILSRMRREYCIPVACGFSFDEIDDESVGQPVVRVFRVADSAIAEFTKAELLAGDHVTWVNAAGGVQHGYKIGMFDQARQGFYLYNTNTAYMPYIVKSGVGVVDSQGNPTVEMRSTQGFLLGSEAHNTGFMPFWNTNATCWAVQKLATGASQAWLLTISGNPSFARVGSGAFPNSINCGSPVTKVNDTVLADQNWDTLMTATENIEAIVNTIDIDFSQRTQWSQNAAVKFGLSYPVGSLFSELVVTFGDASSIQDYIFSDRNSYYGYY